MYIIKLFKTTVMDKIITLDTHDAPFSILVGIEFATLEFTTHEFTTHFTYQLLAVE
jgi:hypothetical protein